MRLSYSPYFVRANRVLADGMGSCTILLAVRRFSIAIIQKKALHTIKLSVQPQAAAHWTVDSWPPEGGLQESGVKFHHT